MFNDRVHAQGNQHAIQKSRVLRCAPQNRQHHDGDDGDHGDGALVSVVSQTATALGPPDKRESSHKRRPK